MKGVPPNRVYVAQAFSDKQLEHFEKVLKSKVGPQGLRDYIFFTFISRTAMKPSEVLRLQVEDIDLGDTLSEVCAISIRHKNGRGVDRVVHISREFTQIIVKYLEGREKTSKAMKHLFISHSKRNSTAYTRITIQAMQAVFSKIKDEAGLANSKLTIESLRLTFLRKLIESNNPSLAVCKAANINVGLLRRQMDGFVDRSASAVPLDLQVDKKAPSFRVL